MRQVLLALALRDETLSGVEAAEVADRALALASGERALDPPGRLDGAEAHRTDQARASERATPDRPLR